MNGGVPEVHVFNRQRAVPLDLPRLRTLGAEAAVHCQKQPGPGEAALGKLETVEISVVSDRVIAGLHGRFMNVPGATDVITFGHGEIILSATTAARQARENGEGCNREIARYIVHGMLHLNGHEDADPTDAAMMWQAQENILHQLWPPDSYRPGIASYK